VDSEAKDRSTLVGCGLGFLQLARELGDAIPLIVGRTVV